MKSIKMRVDVVQSNKQQITHLEEFKSFTEADQFFSVLVDEALDCGNTIAMTYVTLNNAQISDFEYYSLLDQEFGEAFDDDTDNGFADCFID